MVIKLDEILNEQRNYFQDGRTLDVEFRIEKLRILKSAIVNYKEKIVDALYKDLRKNEFEAYTTEIIPVLEDLNLAIKNVKKWAENENVRTPMYLSGVQGGIESFIMKEPLGNILIISAINCSHDWSHRSRKYRDIKTIERYHPYYKNFNGNDKQYFCKRICLCFKPKKHSSL